MDDKRIIELYFRRSDQAIEETASKYGRYCYSIANSILPSHEDAEESVNDTYLDACDWLVCYVRHGASNSRNLLEYAQRRAIQGYVQIVNIGAG